jgi:O-antigen ligase
MLSFFFFPPASPALTILLAIFSLSFSKNRWDNLKKNLKYILLFSAIFWVYLFGMIYTESQDTGWTNIILKFSFLAYPIILGSLQSDFIQKKQLNFLFNCFIAITSLSILYSLTHAAYEYFNNGDKLAFFYSHLGYILHPSYYAMYVNFALFILLFQLTRSNNYLNKKITLLFWLFIPLFMFFLILLESKAGLIGIIIVLMVSMIQLVFYEKSYKKAIAIIVLSLITTLTTITLIPHTTKRVNQAVEAVEAAEAKENNSTEKNSTATRMYLWKVALNSFLEKPFFGYGTGDVKDELFRQYRLEESQWAIEKNYNPHNQYLQTMVATGILGLISLLAILIFSLFYAFKKKLYVYFTLVFLMALNLLVESMFERQAGVMFFAFFNSFLFFYYNEQKNKQ